MMISRWCIWNVSTRVLLHRCKRWFENVPIECSITCSQCGGHWVHIDDLPGLLKHFATMISLFSIRSDLFQAVIFHSYCTMTAGSGSQRCSTVHLQACFMQFERSIQVAKTRSYFLVGSERQTSATPELFAVRWIRKRPTRTPPACSNTPIATLVLSSEEQHTSLLPRLAETTSVSAFVW
jgi:hypothetical protein